MTIIYVLLALSMCVACLFLLAFLWGLHTGQYEDDFSPAHRILFEDTFKKIKQNENLTSIKNIKTTTNKDEN